MAPKLVAFDLDGTLAESKQPMTSEMGALLARLLATRPVAVMSGAGFPQFKKQFLPGLAAEAPLKNLYLFADNAAQCFVNDKGEWVSLYDKAFTPEEKEKIVAAVCAVLNEEGLRGAPVRVWGERIEDRGAQVSFSPLGQQAPLDAKKRWHEHNDEFRMALRAKIARRLPEFSVAAGGLTTIDITRRGITKAYGVRQLSAITGVPIEHMLYVGDALYEGGNDAVVKETGVPVHEVAGPEETAAVIREILGE